jgi:tRNA modification GTPase
MAQGDSIFALASASGKAGIAVLRLSGPLVASCLLKVMQRDQLPPARRAVLAKLYHPATSSILDHALVIWLQGPNSYSGEDMAELHLHGGRAILHSVCDALTQCGLRMAEPGEFSRRAVVNGKMDLTMAEAVMDMVEAETEQQQKAALRQLDGGLRDLYARWSDELTHHLAHLEAAIDFADDDLPDNVRDNATMALKNLATEVQAHLADARRGERQREGLSVVIIGAPNAGKSSLLNWLAQREVAIVTPIAGTTRDVLEVHCDLGGYAVQLVDTAGLRETDNVVEQEGIKRALKRAEQADFKLVLFDGSHDKPDASSLEQIGVDDLVIITKADLPQQLSLPTSCSAPLHISTQTGQGMPELLAAITSKVQSLSESTQAVLPTRARHREALQSTYESLQRAISAPQDDLRAEDVRLARRHLGRITGQVGVEDLLDIIFRDFCLGK